MSIDKSKITLEQIKKAIECETPEELIAYAKSEGFDISVDCDLFSHVIK